MPFVTTADVCDREAAFLQLTADGLPVLPKSAGGKWDLIQAYVPRTPATRQNQIWVTRTGFVLERTAQQRTMPTYQIELRLLWTLSSGVGSAETDQRAFDAAIDDVVMRVLGTPPGFQGGVGMDKTHDGKFLSAAENPRHLEVRYVPADEAMKNVPVGFEARMTYSVDDFEMND